MEEWSQRGKGASIEDGWRGSWSEECESSLEPEKRTIKHSFLESPERNALLQTI